MFFMTACYNGCMQNEKEEAKETISARVGTRSMDRLRKLAKVEDRTVSYLVSKAIDEYVDRAEKAAKK